MGDPAAPTAQESTDSMMKALTANLPTYMKTLSSQILPSEQAMQDASRIISPQQNQLQLDLLKQFGPELNKVGTDIERQNQLARASGDLDVLKGPGAQTVAQTKALDQSLNPEFYKNREQASTQLGNLLGSFDLSGKLSGGENAQIERSLARDNAQKGLTTPTSLGTVSNAMTFGNAGFQRKQAQQQGLGGAIGAATGFLPASKSGIDPLQTGLGRPSQGNVGQGAFQGFQQTGQQAYGLGQGLGQTIGGFQQQANEINANRRSGLDAAMGVAGTLGNMAKCCFIFMEAYNGAIPWYVRVMRDFVETVDMRAGYCSMAHKLVPLMRKSKLVRGLVNYLMIKPLTAHAGYKMKQNSYGWIFTPFEKFWLNTWKLIGRNVTTF